MVQIPMAVFRHQMDMMMAKHVRPQTKKDLGKHMRKLKPIITTREVLEDQLSMARGLPASD